MADIDQIIAGGAGASSRADFSGIAKIPEYYWSGKEQAAKNDLREAFKDGVPLTPDGQPDFGAMAKTLFQKGGLSEGTAASNLDIQRQQLKMGQEAAAAMGRAESPQAAEPIISPSANRGAPVTDGPPRQPMQVNAQPQRAQPPQGGATVMKVLAAQGIPNDQLAAASASIARQLGVDPMEPIDINNPQVRNVLAPAVAQLKRMGIGQAAQPGQPQQQEIPPINPQQNQGTFGAPPATPTRGAVPTGQDPEIQKQIATYTAIASNPAYPKPVQEAALTRLKALQEQGQPTGPMKEYDLARRQGYQGTLQDFIAENEAKKTAATEEAKLGAAKYQSLVENGTKAQMEIPQLELLQEQMKDPNFFSGAGEKYNLLYKRLKSAVGIDPEAAVPQEYLRKATAANVLSSLGALKGLGQIRVAEINMAREAAASPENSVPANQLLVEISKRTHQRNADIAEMAQNYKEKNGTLDPGFDKQVTAYYKKNPLFTDGEIKDWHKVIGQAKPQQASAAPPVPNAKQAPDGNFYVPDPARPGKYLKVVQ
jgi:hypothetical protein